jgi:hypothetical protein
VPDQTNVSGIKNLVEIGELRLAAAPNVTNAFSSERKVTPESCYRRKTATAPMPSLQDAKTRQPLASMAYAYFAPLSEFKARFSRLAPAELALNAAAVELAKLLRGKNS